MEIIGAVRACLLGKMKYTVQYVIHLQGLYTKTEGKENVYFTFKIKLEVLLLHF